MLQYVYRPALLLFTSTILLLAYVPLFFIILERSRKNGLRQRSTRNVGSGAIPRFKRNRKMSISGSRLWQLHCYPDRCPTIPPDCSIILPHYSQPIFPRLINAVILDVSLVSFVSNRYLIANQEYESLITGLRIHGTSRC